MVVKTLLGAALICTSLYFGIFASPGEPKPLRTKLLLAGLYVVLGTIGVGSLFSQRKEINPHKKAVVISGCDSGFGFHLSERLDSLGFTVFSGCLFPDREGAAELRAKCSDRLHTFQLDITDDWQVRKAVEFVKNNLGDNELWALVNNAGVAVFSEIEWCSVTQYQRIMDVNVIGTVRMTKAFLPDIRRSSGRVIMVASLAGRYTFPAFSAYSMSKYACIAFSDGLRREMDKFGVKVITVEPSLYKTPITTDDYMIDMNRKSWAETPTEVKESYGQEYFDAFLKNISKNMQRARSDINEVIDPMVDAIMNVSPNYRYVPYWRTRMRSTIMMYLPTKVLDWLLNKFYSVKCEPHMSHIPEEEE